MDPVPKGALDELDRQIQRGSLFTQAVLQRTSQRVSETEVVLAKVIDSLVERGVLDPAELGLTAADDGVANGGAASHPAGPDPADTGPAAAGPTDTGPALTESTKIKWPAVALRVDPIDTETSDTELVDCGARMPVCHAVCCKLKFPLSPEEVERGAIKWDIGHPYLIRHDSDGCCTHNDRSTHGCTKYDERPMICRTYSCAADTRIWSDFDNMVLNQEWIAEHLSGADGMYFETVAASMDVPIRLTDKRP